MINKKRGNSKCCHGPSLAPDQSRSTFSVNNQPLRKQLTILSKGRPVVSSKTGVAVVVVGGGLWKSVADLIHNPLSLLKPTPSH